MSRTKGLSRVRVENAQARIEAARKMARELATERALSDELADSLREWQDQYDPDRTDTVTAERLARHAAARKGDT